MRKIGLHDVFCFKREDCLIEVIVSDSGDKIAQIYGDAYRWTAFRQDYEIQKDLERYITAGYTRDLVV